MDFFKKNKGITFGMVITIIAVLALGWMVISTSSEVDSLTESLSDQQNVVSDLQNKKYEINSANAEIAKKQLAAAKEKIAGVKNALKAYRVDAPKMEMVDFRQQLSSRLEVLKKSLSDKGVTLSDNCPEVSFKDLKANNAPTDVQIEQGLMRLAIVEELMSKIPATAKSGSLKGVGIERIESIDWTKQEPAVSKMKGFSYVPLELRVVGDQGAIRPFINGVVASDKLFAIVRSVEFTNPVTFAMKKKEKARTVPQPGGAKVEETTEYKEDRKIVNDNKVDWKIYIDILQFSEVAESAKSEEPAESEESEEN